MNEKEDFFDFLCIHSLNDILEKCPDISMSNVELALADLLKNNYIIKPGVGRSTAYIRNTDYR